MKNFHSESRLSQDNIHEEEREIVGRFQGVLPMRRTFEFVAEDTGEVISGKVSLAIEDASAINNVLNSPAKIQVHSKRVGTVRPRYVLLAYEERGCSVFTTFRVSERNELGDVRELPE